MLECLSKCKYLRNLNDFINNGYKLHLFTLNYDDLVERALNDVLGTINDKWTTGFDTGGWQPTLFDDPNRSVNLYKLHGSLDWVDDEELGICSVRWPKAARGDEIPEDYEPLLIFGTAMKLTPTDPYLSLLARLRTRLFYSCGVLIALGYGFGDEHINAVLLEALKNRSELRCIVASKKDDLSFLPQDFKEQIASERFTNIPGPVKDALDQNKVLEALENLNKGAAESPPF